MQPFPKSSIVEIKTLSEEQLINEIKKNPNLFGCIYDEHYSTVFNYCYKRTHEFDAAKDIASETFLKAYLKIHTFKWTGVPIIAWLYRIAINEINLYYRSQQYRPSMINESGIAYALAAKEQELYQEKMEAQNELESHEQFIEVQKILKTLPLKYQEVIALKYLKT